MDAITITSKNGVKIQTTKDVLRNNSNLFKTIIGDQTDEIILEDIVIRKKASVKNTDLFRHIDAVISFCEHYKNGELNQIGKTYKETKFDLSFIGNDLGRIFDIINIAYALEVDGLASLLEYHVAIHYIKGKSPEQLKKTFELPDSLNGTHHF